MKNTWLLIPAFNESAALGGLLHKCLRHCANILVVDDGSADDTFHIAAAAGCSVLRHENNRGKGEALKTGFRWLLEKGCSRVITLDGDGQHDPAEIPNFLDHFSRWNERHGEMLIVGSRERARMPLYRAIPNRIGEVLISLAARRHIPDTQSGYRLYSRGVLEKVTCSASGFDMETEILIKASRKGLRIEQIPIRTIYQENYKTNFRPVVDFYKISIVVLKNIM